MAEKWFSITEVPCRTSKTARLGAAVTKGTVGRPLAAPNACRRAHDNMQKKGPPARQLTAQYKRRFKEVAKSMDNQIGDLTQLPAASGT